MAINLGVGENVELIYVPVWFIKGKKEGEIVFSEYCSGGQIGVEGS